MSLAHAINPPAPLRRPGASAEGFNSYLLNVRFAAPGGAEWSSVGGGESVAEALAAARAALPLGGEWQLAGWNHLYGE